MEHKIILTAIVFLGTVGYLTSFLAYEMQNTEYVTVGDVTYLRNGTEYIQNITTFGDTTQIPRPPICEIEAGTIPILNEIAGFLGCIIAYITFFFGLLFVSSDLEWYNVMVLLPLVAVIGYIIVVKIVIPAKRI